MTFDFTVIKDKLFGKSKRTTVTGQKATESSIMSDNVIGKFTIYYYNALILLGVRRHDA